MVKSLKVILAIMESFSIDSQKKDIYYPLLNHKTDHKTIIKNLENSETRNERVRFCLLM